MKLFAFMTRRRAVVLALLAAVVGCGAAAGFFLHSLLLRQRSVERQTAEADVARLLAAGRRLADEYTLQGVAARERLQRQLSRQAAALCGEVQVFLQAALVGRQERQTREKLESELEKRGKLQELAQAQLRKISELSARVRAFEEMPEDPGLRIPPMTAGPEIAVTDAQPAASALTIPAAGVTDGGDKTARADYDPDAEAKLLAELAAPETEKYDPEWADRLIQECSLDFKNLLPPNCSLIVAEVGKQVLLTLGDGTVKPGEVRGMASLPLMLHHGDDHRQWMLTLTLADVDAPALPTADGLARYCETRLLAGRGDLQGYVLDASAQKILAEFPAKPAAVKPLLPKNNVWVALPEGGSAVYFRAGEEPAASGAYPWRLGVRVELPQPDIAARARALAAAHPLGAAGVAVGCVLLLVAFITVAGLGWSSGTPVYVAAAGAAARAEDLTPKLGSVARLQAANRQRAGASNILATAKSRLLRELATRISPQETPDRDLLPPVKKTLREYRGGK